MAQQAAAYRALVGYAAGHGVGLLGADYLILQLLVLVHIQQFYAAAQRDDAVVRLGLFNNFGLLDEGLQLGYLPVGDGKALGLLSEVLTGSRLMLFQKLQSFQSIP